MFLKHNEYNNKLIRFNIKKLLIWREFISVDWRNIFKLFVEQSLADF